MPFGCSIRHTVNQKKKKKMSCKVMVCQQTRLKFNARYCVPLRNKLFCFNPLRFFMVNIFSKKNRILGLSSCTKSPVISLIHTMCQYTCTGQKIIDTEKSKTFLICITSHYHLIQNQDKSRLRKNMNIREVFLPA